MMGYKLIAEKGEYALIQRGSRMQEMLRMKPVSICTVQLNYSRTKQRFWGLIWINIEKIERTEVGI